MTPDSPTTFRRLFPRLLVPALALLLVLLAWLRPLDEVAQGHLQAGLKRALATYAVARTINGVISVVQETGVSVQPGGVGMTFAPGQFLDPINDLVEQVSTVMLAVCVSFGIQALLLHLGGSALVSALLTAALAVAVLQAWRGRRIPPWGMRLLAALLLVRFAVPLVAMGSELSYRYTMADAYGAAQGRLETVTRDVAPGAAVAGKPADAAAPSGVWEFLKSIPKWGETKSEDTKERGRIEQIRATLDDAVEHILRLVAVFVVQTVLLPLLFLGLLGKGVGIAWR